MKKITLMLAIITGLSTTAYCQVDEESKMQKQEKIFAKVDVESTFTGGDAACRYHLTKYLNTGVPVSLGAPAGQYTVIIKFIVSKDGSLRDFTPETRHGYGMEKQAIVLLQRSPNWQPATINGKKVSSYRRQPITFAVP